MPRERLDRRRGLEGDGQVSGRLPVQPIRLAAEPPADAAARQPQKRPDGADAERVEGVAQSGVDVEPAQENAAGRPPLDRGVFEHRRTVLAPRTGPRQRIRAEPGEPHHDPPPEPRGPQAPPHPARPVHQRGEQAAAPKRRARTRRAGRGTARRRA